MCRLLQYGLATILAAALSAGQLRAQLLATDEFSIYGYLTQGYAVSDGDLLMGIPHTGTYDYRRAALLFRYTPSTSDAFVIQLANRRLGESPTMADAPSVAMDWVFYQHTFDGTTELRVGKMPLPLGIYNEIRYVGTLLPFYRPPYGFYGEGALTSETIDGIEVEHQFWRNKPWQLDATVFGGGYNIEEETAADTGSNPGDTATGHTMVTGQSQEKNVVGGQLQLTTPLDGLHLLGGGTRADSYGGVYLTGVYRQPTVSWHTGLDYHLDRFNVESEFQHVHVTTEGLPVAYRITQWYVQAGVRLIGALSLNGLHDLQEVWLAQGPTTTRETEVNDQGVGFDYKFTATLVAKLEYHHFNGYLIEAPIPPGAPEPIDNYAIASVSVSF